MNSENRAYLKVIQYIRKQLETEQVAIGKKLPTERELADILGLSRNSIREALRTMENMGLLESRQGSGNYLTGNLQKSFTDSFSMMLLSKQVDYLEISQLRRGIEQQALALAMNRITPNELLCLQDILNNMAQAPCKEESLWDKKFHDAIIAASKNRLMIHIMQALSVVCEEVIAYNRKQSNQEVLWQAHQNIYLSLLTKDFHLGSKSLTEHYDLVDKGLQPGKP